MSKGLNLKTIFCLVIIFALAAVLVTRQGRHHRRHDKSLKIDDTEIIVNEIRQISTLVTACWHEDVVMSDSKPSRYFGTDNICLIIKGNVRSGKGYPQHGWCRRHHLRAP